MSMSTPRPARVKHSVKKFSPNSITSIDLDENDGVQLQQPVQKSKVYKGAPFSLDKMLENKLRSRKKDFDVYYYFVHANQAFRDRVCRAHVYVSTKGKIFTPPAPN